MFDLSSMSTVMKVCSCLLLLSALAWVFFSYHVWRERKCEKEYFALPVTDDDEVAEELLERRDCHRSKAMWSWRLALILLAIGSPPILWRLWT